MTTLIGHDSPIFCLNISFDGEHCITGSGDGKIRMWNLLKGCAMSVYKGHQGPVWDVKFCPYSASYFASASEDMTACVWVMNCSSPVKIFWNHLSDVTSVAFNQNLYYLATGCSDGSVWIWDIRNPEIEECESLVRVLISKEQDV